MNRIEQLVAYVLNWISAHSGCAGQRLLRRIRRQRPKR